MNRAARSLTGAGGFLHSCFLIPHSSFFMGLHILIGHEKPGQRGAAQALYVGPSGAELQQVKAKATCGSFTILNNPPGLRKSNGNYIPPAAEPVTAGTEPAEPPPRKAKK